MQMVNGYILCSYVIKAYFSSSQSQFTLSRFTVFAYLVNIDTGWWSTSPLCDVVLFENNISQYPQANQHFD